MVNKKYELEEKNIKSIVAFLLLKFTVAALAKDSTMIDPEKMTDDIKNLLEKMSEVD